MYPEDSLLPISALQHLIFCERQCALIHIERQWVENRLTAEGRLMHTNAHDGPDEQRGAIRIARGIPLKSAQLGLVGVSDVVEFKSGVDGVRRPFPVEYKRGKPKSHDADLVQLCAQALCLEEMFGTEVSAGALYYGATRRRTDVSFDAWLRELTMRTAKRLHELLDSGMTPRARRAKKCTACSLLKICLPEPRSGRHTAAQYFAQGLQRSLAATDASE